MDVKPAIIVVDDESDALAAIREALTRRFGGDYGILPYPSARAALGAVCSIKEKGEEIALVIADQRMPEMQGSMQKVQACHGIFYIRNGVVESVSAVGTGGARCYTNENFRPGFSGTANIQ
jgi:hypothetical protein